LIRTKMGKTKLEEAVTYREKQGPPLPYDNYPLLDSIQQFAVPDAHERAERYGMSDTHSYIFAISPEDNWDEVLSKFDAIESRDGTSLWRTSVNGVIINWSQEDRRLFEEIVRENSLYFGCMKTPMQGDHNEELARLKKAAKEVRKRGIFFSGRPIINED